MLHREVLAIVQADLCSGKQASMQAATQQEGYALMRQQSAVPRLLQATRIVVCDGVERRVCCQSIGDSVARRPVLSSWRSARVL